MNEEDILFKMRIYWGQGEGDKMWYEHALQAC